MAAGVAEELGLEVVDLVLRGPRGRQMLRVDVDRPGPLGVTLDDCQRVSEQLAAGLDDADLMPGAYTLEVSSPGLDRPLRTADDYRRNRGRHVAIEVQDEASATRTIEGRLIEHNADHVLLEAADGTRTSLQMRHIVSARQCFGARPGDRAGA